nr:putative F-box protein At1g65770 [Quercus suber]POE63852.1 f-box protein [Quercus suber]
MSESLECSELPEELLLPIGKGLDTRIEILRFRGVCKSWRSAISCSDFIPRFPLNFPNPSAPPLRRLRRRLAWLALFHDAADHLHQQTICLLHETILYRLTPSASSDKGWLIKIEDCKCKMHLLDPHRQSDGKLGHAKCGDESLTCLGEKDMEFDDVIVYEGQVYVVDRFGIGWWIRINDSTLDLVEVWNPCGSDSLKTQKHLVESDGTIYIVDRHLDREWRGGHYACVVGFKVYKKNEWDEWVLEESLGDRAFILRCDCSLSISTREFFGYEGNCIYFTQQKRIHVFKLENNSITKADLNGDKVYIQTAL